MKVVGGVLHGPDEGWGDQVYVVVVPPGAKAGEATEDGAATTGNYFNLSGRSFFVGFCVVFRWWQA